MTFLYMIAFRNKTGAYTFLPSFGNANGRLCLLLVFSVTPPKIDQNQNQNHSTDKVQNLGNERR